jgi:SAM-dependent methyltransferase
MPIAKTDFTTRFFKDAGISTGMRVLDVGCGSGDLSFFVAGLVGTEGSVVGIDHDLTALRVARQRIEAENTPSPEFVQSDLLSIPSELGQFDAIVGRRVLMYQPNIIAAVRALARSLKPSGIVAFQEHDSTLVPAALNAFPLHRQAQGWIKEMLAREGADLNIGFNLHKILTEAGLKVDDLRAECLLQMPDQPNSVGNIVKACLPRIVSLGVASAEIVDIATLQARLDTERQGSEGIYISDIIFGACAHKPY